MDVRFTVDEYSDTPLYKQIANGFYAEIISGRIAGGDKLPTVRELAEEMSLSRGTVKHAYEHLESIGVIELVQGKGSFVVDRDGDVSSRKEKAMTAIDRLFDEMEDLGFTPREIEIYLKLKLQGLQERYDLVKVAVVDCNPETIKQIEQQLSGIEFLETASFPLNQIDEVAEKLNRDYDLILTTSTHYAQVENLIRDVRRIAMMAMVPTPETLIRLARLKAGEKAGIVCASDTYARIIKKSCSVMGEWAQELPQIYFGSEARLNEFLTDKTAVIVPECFEAFAKPEEVYRLHRFEEDGGKLICYNYTVDRGSFLHVEQLVKKTLNKKRSK